MFKPFIVNLRDDESCISATVRCTRRARVRLDDADIHRFMLRAALEQVGGYLLEKRNAEEFSVFVQVEDFPQLNFAVVGEVNTYEDELEIFITKAYTSTAHAVITAEMVAKFNLPRV